MHFLMAKYIRNYLTPDTVEAHSEFCYYLTPACGVLGNEVTLRVCAYRPNKEPYQILTDNTATVLSRCVGIPGE